METEQVFVFLWSRGDLNDGDGEAVGGRSKNGRSQCDVVFIQELCRKDSYCISQLAQVSDVNVETSQR